MNQKCIPERTLILLKPDALQRNLLGEVISRFERKGLKIAGVKMMQLTDEILKKHYQHLKNKPFFDDLRKHMERCPVVAMVLEGYRAISAARLIAGPTDAAKADAGTIRGDLSLSTRSNLVHASEDKKAAEREIYLFFSADELFDYQKLEFDILYCDQDIEAQEKK